MTGGGGTGGRAARLGRLVALHGTLEAVAEARRAGHLARAREHRTDAEALAARFDDPESLSALFPMLYHDRIKACLAAADAAEAAAGAEAAALAHLRRRTERIRDARDAAAAAAERQDAERLLLDWVETRQAAASSPGQTDNRSQSDD